MEIENNINDEKEMNALVGKRMHRRYSNLHIMEKELIRLYLLSYPC